ncbi:MAG: rRNA maturation RNase YbeY [Solirubrobacterales bacterium]
MSRDALEIELIVEEGVQPGVPEEDLIGAARATLDRLGVEDGHVAIEIVGEFRIHQLNREFRGKDDPTDVLSFPVDGEEIAIEGPPVLQVTGALELGDVAINPEHTENMVEAVVHGVLHLCGYDHEVDDGEMLELQDEIVHGLE